MAARVQIPDTSVLIALARDASSWPEFPRLLESGGVWFSSVAIAELFAGTRSPEDARQLARLVGAFRRAGRIVTPTHDDWVLGGQLLARWSRLRGQIRPRDHLADVLICLSAASIAGTVLTANVRHFNTWSSLARKAGLDVTVTPFQPRWGSE